MRTMLTVLLAAALWCGLVSLGNAADAKAASDDKAKKSGAASPAATQAELRAEIHRKMAELIEAQAAENPDQAKIDGLIKELQRLRVEYRSQGIANVRGAAWSGPGVGAGLGNGQGPGWGVGWGAGRGPAWGAGGMGIGRVGPGMGPGWGPGRGWSGGAAGGGAAWGGGGRGRVLAPGGPAFVDENRNGVCDWFELRRSARP